MRGGGGLASAPAGPGPAVLGGGEVPRSPLPAPPCKPWAATSGDCPVERLGLRNDSAGPQSKPKAAAAIHRDSMSVHRGRSRPSGRPSIPPRARGQHWFRLPSLRPPIRSMLGGQGMRTRGHRGGTVPTGSGQEQCGDPECHPANPAPGPQTLGAACPAPQQPFALPPRRSVPTAAALATLTPASPPPHQARSIRGSLIEEPWTVGPTSSATGPLPSGTASTVERVTARR